MSDNRAMSPQAHLVRRQSEKKMTNATTWLQVNIHSPHLLPGTQVCGHWLNYNTVPGSGLGSLRLCGALWGLLGFFRNRAAFPSLP